MNRKIIIILSGAAILLLIIGGIFWFYSEKPVEERPEIISGLFPSAEERLLNGLPGPGELTPAEFGEERDFIQLSQEAVSGAAFARESAAARPDSAKRADEEGKIRYIEKSTGHIYEIGPDGKDISRISNTTILKVFQSFWSPEADKLIMRYFENGSLFGAVKSFSAAINSATKSVEGIFLPQSTTEIAVSPEEEKIFYLNELDGRTIGITANFENERQNTVLSLPFGEFNAIWPSKNIIALLSKPAGAADGFLYFLNPRTEEMERIIGGVKGLTVLASPDGQKVIYSQSAKKSFSAKVFDNKEKISNGFGLRTLPEKCVWSAKEDYISYCGAPNSLPRAEYPDDWYKGIVSFDDSVWKVNISTGETNLLLEETNADIINPFLTPDENYLIFTNKKDNTLWSLKIGD